MDGILIVMVLLVSCAVSAGIGYWIRTMKGGMETEGAMLGGFLGPIGWIIAAILPAKERAALAKISNQSFGAPVRPGQLHEMNKGVKLRCPNCGEEGFVPKVEEGVTTICPTCKEKFEPRSNLATA
jgi:hypothetical protein